MKGSLIIYRASKTKTKAKSWPNPDRSREKACYMAKSANSQLHANRDSGGEDKEIQSTGQLDFDLRNNEEDGAE